MTNIMITKNRQAGFTLVEMLVVAALIAIFAAIAVFNVTEQLNREKVKAATAETRSIATAMSFAYDDLSFFPKLCFLKLSVEEMSLYATNHGWGAGAADYFGAGIAADALGSTIGRNWQQKYLAGSLPEKVVEMEIPGTNPPDGYYDWPADPFKRPYVAYLAKIKKRSPTADPTVMWLHEPADSSGRQYVVADKPNYFAGILSYGRNGLVGAPELVDSAVIRRDAPLRITERLFHETANARRFRLLLPTEYDQAKLDRLINPVGDGPAPGWANIRGVGSDDRYYEF